jgi:DNA-binding NtrC family response regulator
MLAARGYCWCGAAGGIKAHSLLEDGEKFDLILADLVKDRLGGIGLLERSSHQFPDLPVALIMTTPHSLSGALEGIRKGAYDFLLLPF